MSDKAKTWVQVQNQPKPKRHLIGVLYNNVDKVTILEPFDKKILANLTEKCNSFHKLILLMQLDTQTYYNIRIVLRLGVHSLIILPFSSINNSQAPVRQKLFLLSLFFF